MVRSCLLALVLSLTGVAVASAADMYVYFGTHESGPTRGLSLAHFDTETGKLTPPKLDLQADMAGFFVISSSGKNLYTANAHSTYKGQANMGSIGAYSLDPATGKLALINEVPSGGNDPSYIRLDKTEKFALVANYWGNHVDGEGGNVAVFAIKPDGSLGDRTAFVQHKGKSVNPTRQNQAYAHSVVLDPTNKFALVADLGLDKILVYKFDEKTGTLTPNDPPSVSVQTGSGPRHVTFHPNGKYVYVVQELANLVTGFTWDGTKGTLQPMTPVSSIPDEYFGRTSAAEIVVHPSGKFLYVTNRGHDSIATFIVNQETGHIAQADTTPTGGKTPRNFDIDPTGNWIIVTNHGSDNAVVFKIDQRTGAVKQQGDPVYVLYPFCPRFLPVPAK